jgi:hypothetical protein
MTCGQSTAPRLSRFDHEPRPKPVSCNEDLPASLADVSALDSRRNLKPGRQKSLQVPRGHLLGCSGGRSSRTAHPSGRATEFSEAGLVFHHPWRRALTQCRARYHISTHPCGWPIRMQVRSFRRGDWSLPTFWVADARGSLSWTPLRGADASAGIGLALRAQTCRSSGVDTTHRPGGSRALSSSRATYFPNPPEFWSVARHRFNGVAMTLNLQFSRHPLGCAVRFRYPSPTLRVGYGRRRTLRVRHRGFCCRRLQRAASVCCHTFSRVALRFFCQSVDAGRVEGFPSTPPPLAASEVLDGARVPFGAFRTWITFAG